MQKKILNFMEEYHMVKEGECILAAVSGGADSLCLLLVLLELQHAGKFRLCAVHVEHGIRGEDSEGDARFVENFCKERQVPCKVFRCQAEAYARQHKMTVEEGARSLRYAFFEQAAEEFGADRIAVAHNKNDCAETMLFHLVRGTGLKGMCGILPVRGRIIRPLLCVERREIEGYLAGNGQGFCQDKTNEELDYARNRLRHQVFPVLEKVNNQAVAHMNQAAFLVAQAVELVEDMAKEAAEKYFCQDGQGLFVSEGILEERPILKESLLLKAMIETAGNSKDISGCHVRQIQELFGRQAGKLLDLPYGIRAERAYGGVILKKKEKSVIPQGGCWELPLEGILEIPEYGCEIRTRLLENHFQNEEIPKKMYTKWMDCDKIKGTVQLRARREGDFLVISPDGRRKKLNRYFIDEKVSRQKRDQVLLLADGAHVLWAIGCRISEDVKVTEDTRRILEIQVYGGDVHE